MHLVWLIHLLLLLFIPSQVFASNEIRLSECNKQCSLPLPIEIFEDTEQSISPQTLHNHPTFNQYNEAKPNFGPSNADYWIRFAVHNDTDNDQVIWLELTPYVTEATLIRIQPTASGTTSTQLMTPLFITTQTLETRDIDHVKPILRMSIGAKETHSYYLKIKSIVAIMDFTFWNVEHFAKAESHHQYIFGLWYGLMLVMIIYNLFLFLSIRDRSYLFYCLYLACLVLNQMGISGHSLYIAPSKTAPLYTEIFGIAYSFWAIQFVKSFLNTKQYSRINLLLNALSVSLLIPLYFLLIANHEYCIITMNTIGIAIITSVSIAGVHSFNRGFKPARFFILAWFFLLVGALVFVLRGLGYIPSNVITENSVRIGAAIEVFLLSLALADRINQFKQEKQKEIELRLSAFEKIEQMRRFFQKFVPHQFIELLQKDNILALKPGDHIQRSMTVLFSDIRSFTELSESMTPTENFKFINSYLSKMEPHIQNNNGFIDKFIGDAIMALFDDSADDALNAGISMIRSLELYNKQRASRNYRPLSLGIGINTGSLILGTVGDESRMDSTVISDAVNLASRIEGLCKRYGVPLLISQETHNALTTPGNYSFRLIDIVKTKGKKRETTIFEVLNADTKESADLKIATSSLFNDAFRNFQEGNYTQAKRSFEEIVSANPLDTPAKLYVQRCEKRCR